MPVFHGINIPRERHLSWLLFFDAVCERLQVGFAIKGSLAAGTAREYSDIDVLVFMAPKKTQIDDLIGFELPLMVNFTERPPGIVMVSYGDGLCVELDCRETVTAEELEGAVVVRDSNLRLCSGPVMRRAVVSSHAYQYPYSMDLRLLYKALIKKLCERHEAADGLLEEFHQKVGGGCIEKAFSGKAERLYERFVQRHVVAPALDAEMRFLLHTLPPAALPHRSQGS